MRLIAIALALTMLVAALAATVALANTPPETAIVPADRDGLQTPPGYFAEGATPPSFLGINPETGTPWPGVIGTSVTLRALDKVTAETRDIEGMVGEDVTFGSLVVRVHYCRKRPPEEPPEVLALLEVFDRRTDGGGSEVEPLRIFSGWMFASNPALNPLEHPVFDIWVLDCA